ncbi:uncharacterized protein LOC143592653 [Bidens hawaiensis]|uniref:uncharacterized protein LOC143592653 n=1 Tax=Bidens hawaiensis TaxID=980011 RepID=UPI004049811F
MSTHKLLTLKSYFNIINDSFPSDFMMKVCSFIWVFVLSSFRHFVEHLIGFIWVFVLSSFRHLIERLTGTTMDGDHVEILGKKVVYNEKEDEIVRNSSDSARSIVDTFGGDEKSEFTFGFRFQMTEEDMIGFHEVKSEKTEDVLSDIGLASVTTASKYQFMSVQDFGGFVEEPESGSFTVHEVFVESSLVEDDAIIENESSNLSSKVDDFIESEVNLGESLQKVDLSDKDSIFSEEKFKETVTDASCCDEIQDLRDKNGVLKTEEVNNWLEDFLMRNDSFGYEYDSSRESEFDDSVIEPEPESASLFVPDDHEVDGACIEPEPDLEKELHVSESNNKHESDSCFPMKGTEFEEEINVKSWDFDSKDENFVAEEIDDDVVCIEPETDLEKELHNSESNDEHESYSCLLMNGTEFEEESYINSWEFDSDEEEEYDDDILLEHRELIDQMKMELKNARTGGLPTILEEVETPRLKEDYKPLKVNERLEHRDQMAEIQKFYKSYNEKMRKLDVLNYQTLQAINFLRMKHPDQLNTGENTSLSAIKSVVFPSLWPCKLRRIYADPTLKSITELYKDLEIVYVGQACLSWEILHWQYKKAKELQLYDPQGFRSYNQTAIEFQQFHVLLKRFTEDELFQGPRVQNYTKRRCTVRGLLQVPAIKDDSLKEKRARKQEQEDAVSISSMTKIIKESMGVFWEFLHRDKDTTNLFLTIILQGSKANLQDPQDSDLFMQIKTIYQMKDKRLKDMLGTGNCIVKRFQKQQETILDQHMFVSQVELRLISRVLNLPRLTRDQLLWCHNKLNNIIFIDRKVHVEHSLFFGFPMLKNY